MTRQTTAGTPADGFRTDPPPVPQPRRGDDPTEPGRRNTEPASTGKHSKGRAA